MRNILCTLLLSALLCAEAQSQAAFFDPSFGNNGFVETDFGYPDVAGIASMALQPDGKLLVRYAQSSHFYPDKRRVLRLARYLPDGSLDSSFANAGTLLLIDTIVSPGSVSQDRQLLLLPNGKILTTLVVVTQAGIHTQVLQFDKSGKPDPRLGTGGKLDIQEDAGSWQGYTPNCAAILKMADGKIMLCYQSFNGSYTDLGFRLLAPNGALLSGSEVTWAATDPASELASQWIATADNSVLACGRVDKHDAPFNTQDMLIGKFDLSGFPVDQFGELGFVRQDISQSADIASDFQVLPGGKLLCIGTAGQHMFLARFTADGQLDSTFQGVGYRRFQEYFPTSGVLSYATVFSKADSDQRFVVAVQAGNNLMGALLRMRTDGSVDSSFNGGTPVLFPDNLYSPHQVLSLPDRRIIVCGVKRNSTGNNQLFIARLFPEVDPLIWYGDADGDGFGNPGEIKYSVGQPTGFAGNASDCDDANAQIFPGATERCNGLDDDCDGTADENPAVACQTQLTLVLDASGLATLDVSQILLLDSTFNCWDNATQLQLNQSAFDCTQTGQQTVTLTATTSPGDSSQCQTSVQVLDQQTPIALCQVSQGAVLDANGQFTLSPLVIDAGSNDNCGIASLSVSPSQFSTANLGSNLVTLTATDSAGNQTTCSSTLQISMLIGTGQPALSKTDVHLSPNPASDILYLRLAETLPAAPLRLDLLDAQGRVLRSQTETSGARTIPVDVRQLPAGHYFLRLQRAGASLVLDVEKG